MKHQRSPRYDKVYDLWSHIPCVRSITVLPLKTIYYNRAAHPDKSVDIVLRTAEEVERYCILYRLLLR